MRPGTWAASLAKGALVRLAGEPGAAAVYRGDTDSAALAGWRLAILRRKTALREAIEGRDAAIWSACDRWCRADGPVVEIGTGLVPVGGRPALHTDIYPAPGLDCLASGQALPFADSSLSALVGIHALHHLPDPGCFFGECTRTLAPGGVALLIEPNHNRLSAFAFGRLHPERFDRRQHGWTQVIQSDNEANQALAWIIFDRDREEFLRRFPALEICESRPLESLSFLLTGGYLLRQMAPSGVIRMVAERAGRGRILDVTAVHRLVVLRRRA